MSEALRLLDCTTAEEVMESLRRVVTAPTHGVAEVDRWLWRGQANADWKLVPSAFRAGTLLGFRTPWLVTGEDLGSWSQLTSEFAAVSEFLHLADKVGLEVAGHSQILRRWDVLVTRILGKSGWGGRDWPPVDVLELMELAQHHGVPTRLLDFSLKYGVAAFFGASGAVGKRGKFAIWGIDANFLKTAARLGDGERITRVTVPRALNRYLHAQHGLFLLDRWIGAETQYGDDVREVEPQLNRAVEVVAARAWEAEGKVPREWLPLVKIQAPADIAPDLLHLLSLEFCDAVHVMPSFESVLKALRERQRLAAEQAAPRKVVADASG